MFISSVSTVVPKTRRVFEAINIPYGVIVTPFIADVLPRVQFPRGAIVRCLCCSSYISLYSRLDFEDKTWKCSICTHENELPQAYSQVFHPNLVELNEMNYEIYAEENYMERPPMCPCYLFLIDVSEESVCSGFLSQVCGILTKLISLKYQQNEERTLVGFLLFGNSVHVVSIVPYTHIVSFPGSLQESWMPYPSDTLTVNLVDHYKELMKALKLIQNFQPDGQGRGFRKALVTAKDQLEHNGGKLLCFLFNPSQESQHPKKLAFLPSTDFFHKLSKELVDLHISTDVFVAGNKFCGFFTYTELARQTGGEAFYYKDFTQDHFERLESDLKKVLEGVKGWEAALRLRLSTDWKIYHSYGNFLLKKDLLKIPCCSAASFTFDLAPKFGEHTENFLTVQGVLLYTSSDGIRLIRVMNFQAAIEDNIDVVLKSINCDVLINFYFKHAVNLIFNRHLILSGSKYLESKAIEVIKDCLIAFGGMPLNLKDFIVRILGLIKHTIFNNNYLPCICN